MTATNEKSEYIESLSKEGKKVYLAKLTLSNGKQLPDPFFSSFELVPDITYMDIYYYLIEYPSLFSKEVVLYFKLSGQFWACLFMFFTKRF